MLRNIFLVSLLVYAVCADQWEIREVESAEDQDEEISADGMLEQPMSVRCEICKKIIKEVKKKITSNATPDEIKAKLTKTCDKLKLLSGPCKNFVKKNLHGLVDELMTNDGPNAICKKIHVCKSEP